MRDNCLITVVLMLISIPATSQTSVSRVFPGTNLRIQLTDDFITSKTIPGFYQEADSTRIFAVQSNNNLSLDQFIAEHQKNLMGAGSIIKKTEKFKHHEFDAALIDYEQPVSARLQRVLLFNLTEGLHLATLMKLKFCAKWKM
jgi:hypothetical protein